MEREPNKLQPDLERRGTGSRVQRLESRRESEISRISRQRDVPPPTSPPPPPHRALVPPWTWGRIVAIVLLAAGSGIMIGGSDQKVSRPPGPPSAAVLADEVQDEIVVDLRDDATDAEIAGLSRSLGIELRYNSIHAKAAKLMVARVRPTDQARILAALRANSLVEAAEPQILYHLDQTASAVVGGRFVPNDPEYPRQWHLKMIGMEEAWTRAKGRGATVAVIDSGVGGATAGGLIQGQDFKMTQFVTGYDFADGRDLTPDVMGHGTHVTGTIAESTDNGVLGAGVAPEARVMPLRVCDDKGRLKMSAVADALHYSADHYANVANMSLGGPHPSTILENAMSYALKKKVALVCSAGNSGKEGVGYPGRYPSCITVSAVGPGALMASYSTWGKELDVAAPGGDPKMGEEAEIWQNSFMQRRGWLGGAYGPRVDGFFPLVGTSMAAPHVTGVAALLVSMGMTDPKEIRSQIRKSARPYTPTDHYGAGLLDAAKATESLRRAGHVNGIQVFLAVGACALLLTARKNLQEKTNSMYFVHQTAVAFAIGLFLPVAFEKVVGFGNNWNLVGHSVIFSILFFTTPKMDWSGFWKVFAFTLGISIHLLLDADSGKTPFEVMPAGRILFWLYLNVAVATYFAASAWRAMKTLGVGMQTAYAELPR